jgi:hypothetical protein
MSLRWYAMTVLVLTSGLLALALPATSAQDKKKPGVTDEVEVDTTLELATTAYKTAEFGDKNKSPEALVTAALMLRSLKKVKKTAIAEIPTDENGKPVEEKALEDDSFEKEAEELFIAARGMAATLNIKGFDAIVDGAMARNEDGTRYVVGGTKSIKRRIGPGKTEIFHVKFRCAEPCPFAFNASRPLHFKVERTDIHHVWVDGTRQHYHHDGHPYPGGKRGELAPVVFRIHNPHKKEHAEYHLFIK